MIQSLRLLVVDDEPEVLNLLVSFLSNAGYRVDRASGIAEAMRLIDAHEYDLAVVDKNMQGIMTVNDGGIEIVRELHERMPNCKVLAITGCPDETELESMMGSGAHEWMAKPFSMRDFLLQIERLAGGHSDRCNDQMVDTSSSAGGNGSSSGPRNSACEW